MSGKTEVFYTAFNSLVKDIENIVDEEFQDLKSELYRTSPVLSGEFKGSWTPMEHKQGTFQWQFSNKADHASILARGRLPANGRWYGSNKNGWTHGVDGFINRFERKVEVRSKDVHY